MQSRLSGSVSVALEMVARQAKLLLATSIERLARLDRPALLLGIVAVDRGAAIGRKG